MPQAAIVPFFTALGATAATAASLAAITQVILINIALGAISRLLAKKPRTQRPAVNVTVRNPIENRKLVWGTVRVGGSFLFYDVSGTNNKYLWYVIAVAGHQISAIKDVWLDSQRVANSVIGGGAAGGGAVPSGVFADRLWIYKHLGESGQNVDPELNQAFAEITNDHRCRGIGLIVVKMEHDPEKFPQGAPQSVTALIDGALVYDPRKDSTNGGSGTHRRENPSTWEFGSGALAIGRNPALIWRWFNSGGSVHNDKTSRLVRYGLRVQDTRIPDNYVVAAANACDEMLTGAVAPPSGSQPRYRCDLEVSTGESRREILEDILATMAGTHVVVHGKHRVFAGVYDSPTHDFTELDLYGQLEIEDTVDHDRRYNRVAGVFRAANNEWTEQTTPFRTDAQYEAQDGGVVLPIEIDLRGVTDQHQAQRLCEIKLRKSRMMRTIKMIGALNLMRVSLYETLTFSFTRYGWQNRIFRCLEKQLEFREDAGRVSLLCQREDPGVYADMLTADYTTGTSDTDVFRNETPDPPSGLRTIPQENGFLCEFAAPAVLFPGSTYEARISSSSSMSSPTTIYGGPDLQFFVSRTSTANAYVQVRTVRNGVPSDWHPLTKGVRGNARSIATPLSASVQPGSVSSETGSASQTTAAAAVTAQGGTPSYTYAWTWTAGGSGITINNPTSASSTFTSTSLNSGETRTGTARCTITDAAMATTTVDVDVSISRPAAVITAIRVGLFAVKISPNNASVAFRYDSDGHVYTSTTTASPATDRGRWCDPVEYASLYQIRVTRTGGSETAFTSGTLATWLALSSDREWRLTESTDGFAQRDIEFTIEIRRASDSVVVATSVDNRCEASVEI